MSQTNSQADKFRDLARELKCDESEDRFNEALKRVSEGVAPKKGAARGKSAQGGEHNK